MKLLIVRTQCWAKAPINLPTSQFSPEHFGFCGYEHDIGF